MDLFGGSLFVPWVCICYYANTILTEKWEAKSSLWTVVSHFVQSQQTISWSDYDMQGKADFIWQLAMTSSVVEPRRNSKAFPKVKLAPKKGHGHCLVICCPSDPLQLSESQRHHYIWELCSADQWDAPKTAMPEANIGQQKWPILLHDNARSHVAQPTLQRLNELS